jgi:hypothetical protein
MSEAASASLSSSASSDEERSKAFVAALTTRPGLAALAVNAFLSTNRPTLSMLYSSARSSDELRAGLDERSQSKSSDGLKGLELVATLFGFVHNARVQAYTASAYASALLLLVDNGFYELKYVGDIDKDRHGGPLFQGQEFSRLVRAATNQLRHGHGWRGEPQHSMAKQNIATLRAIGIEDVVSNSVPMLVLNVIRGDSYFEFEKSLGEALLCIILGKSNAEIYAENGGKSPIMRELELSALAEETRGLREVLGFSTRAPASPQ